MSKSFFKRACMSSCMGPHRVGGGGRGREGRGGEGGSADLSVWFTMPQSL